MHLCEYCPLSSIVLSCCRPCARLFYIYTTTYSSYVGRYKHCLKMWKKHYMMLWLSHMSHICNHCDYYIIREKEKTKFKKFIIIYFATNNDYISITGISPNLNSERNKPHLIHSSILDTRNRTLRSRDCRILIQFPFHLICFGRHCDRLTPCSPDLKWWFALIRREEISVESWTMRVDGPIASC